MIPTPEGLTLPDCACFNKQAKKMNEAIDNLAGLNILRLINNIDTMRLCPKAVDYFIAAMIWSCLASCVLKKDEDKGQLNFEDYTDEYEKAYDRLKPLVMQRLVYSDGVLGG